MKRAPQRKLKTQAPDHLEPEEFEKLRAWCEKHYPDELPILDEHIAACFDHFRGEGKGKVDWVATCRNWVRKAPTFRRGPSGRGGGGGQRSRAATTWERRP